MSQNKYLIDTLMTLAPWKKNYDQPRQHIKNQIHYFANKSLSSRSYGFSSSHVWIWKRSVFIPISKKGNAKVCSNYHTIACISHARKVMLKILQARLQQYLNREAVQLYKLDLEKTLHIRWPKYWNFNFSISPFFFFRIDLLQD